MNAKIGIVYSSNKRRQKVLDLVLNAFYKADIKVDLFLPSGTGGKFDSQISGFVETKSAIIFVVLNDDALSFFLAGYALRANVKIAFICGKKVYLPLPLKEHPYFVVDGSLDYSLTMISAIQEISPEADYSKALRAIEAEASLQSLADADRRRVAYDRAHSLPNRAIKYIANDLKDEPEEAAQL